MRQNLTSTDVRFYRRQILTRGLTGRMDATWWLRQLGESADFVRKLIRASQFLTYKDGPHNQMVKDA